MKNLHFLSHVFLRPETKDTVNDEVNKEMRWKIRAKKVFLNFGSFLFHPRRHLCYISFWRLADSTQVKKVKVEREKSQTENL